MAVVLLKVFEEASLSGELKLSGRKLKDFPKAVGKYNLSDTVIADLSRNRLCELPEDVTGFPFLETLLMYHNTLRTIPETIRGLHSLTFLDLRSNLLTTLPRELCFLPIQVLLVSNNRLVSLPEELGRMEELTELDAACNQITHLPARMSDLKSLKSLSLRNNHLVYLPRDVTCLNLVLLDISCNRIATLPVELRLMTNLVRLELDSNPLTSPPASLCVRGLVHVFKFLDTMAIKEEKSKAGGSFDGHTTLRRNAAAKHSNSAVSDIQKMRRHNVDSGYSTSDGFDKRWSQELPPNGSAAVAVGENANSKWSPTPLHIRTSVDKNSPTAQNNNPNHSSSPYQQQTSATSTPNHSPAGNNNISSICNNSVTDEFKRPANPSESSTPKRSANSMNGSSNSSGSNNSNDVSPDGDFTSESQKSGDKLKSLGNIQTYREYKEALRQQRNQDSNAIYRPKDSNQITPQDSTPPSASTNDSPLSQLSSSFKSNTSTPSPTSTSNPNSPISPQHTSQSNNKNVETSQHTLNNTGNLNHSNGAHVVANGTSEAISNSTNSNIGIGLKSPLRSDKPIQKVTPSRNSAPIKYHHQVTSPTNGNQSMIDGSGNKSNLITAGSKDCGIYVKPNSPVKPNATSNGSSIIGTSTAKSSGKGTQKSPRSVSWNRDIPSEKLSFTMRREFDRQKEESELIEQLRSTIESRLKMSLPKDVASALTDGVVLCHLANHVRPRSVASIHVPSPAVPKLTMARCRRNVDNFLDACRKIGVDEELICSCADIVPSDGLMSLDAAVMDDNKTTTTHTASPRTGEQATSKSIEHSSGVEKHHSAPPNLSAMFQTIAALIDIGDKQSSYGRSTSHSPATNTKIPANNSSKGSSRIEEIHNYNQYFKTVGIHFQKTSTLLLQHEQQSELLTADHLNEYSLIDDYDNNDFVPNEDSVYDVNQAALLNSESSRFCGSESIATTNNELIPSSQDADNSNNHITEHARYNFNNHKRAHDFSSHSDSNKNINCRHSVNNNNNNENKNSFDEWPVRRSPRKTPNTLDLSLSNTTVLNVNNANATTNSGTFNTLTIKKRKMSNNKRNFSQIGNSGKYSEQFPLNGIVEECEYDSDIGKFNCKVGNAATDQITSDNSSGSYDFSEENIRTSSGSSSDERTINDLNASPKQRSLQPIESTEEFNINATIDCTKKIVMKRIEFFENNSNGNGTECKVVNINVMDEDVVDGSAAHVADNKTKQLAQQTITSDTRISTILCLSSFVFVVVILYFFPLPA